MPGNHNDIEKRLWDAADKSVRAVGAGVPASP